MRKSTDTVAVTMIGRNWTLLYSILVEYINMLIEARNESYDEKEIEELTFDIRELIQKMMPVLYYAADKSEHGVEMKKEYRGIQKKAAVVVPEQIEDAIKHVVIFIEEEILLKKK